MRKLVLLISVTVVLSLFMGCPNNGVVSDGVVILDKLPGVTVTSVTPDQISLTSQGAVPITTGDIVVGQNGDTGYLRKVTAVGQKGNEVVAITEPASLEDAVQEGMLMTTVKFDINDFKKAGVLPNDAKATIVNFSGKEIYRGNGILITVDKGILDCTPQVALIADYKAFQLNKLDLTTTGTITLTIDLKVALDNQTPISQEWDIIPPIVHPFVANIGPIPIYGRVTLRFPFGLVAQMTGDTSVKSGFDIKDTFTLKAVYESGNWNNSKADLFNFTFDGHPLTWNIDIGGTAQAYIKAIVELTLYESAEAELFGKPYLTSNIHVFPSPASIEIIGGFDGGAYLGLSVLGHNIVGKSFYWNGPSKLLYRGVQDYSDPLPWTSGSIDLW
ncbi:MAG TPA: hypothetical protein PLT82_09985 [Candidatus Hydrogenedens sp.]|nr:hypothetical protein [Candidatus Hydrogenedens sp.]HOL20607.1 hypothetical protein [Candidatus Hydrogenedens sp.]HPP59451.1 hypothetical protein [Candidatus Hydrogenedens sp.]